MKFGYLWGITSGLLWAVSGVLYEVLNRHFSQTSTIHVLLVLLFLIESIPLFLIRKKHIQSFFANNYKILFGLVGGILGGPVGMLCYLYAIQYIGVEYAAPITSIYPVFGAILSFLLLKDKIKLLGLIGLIVSIACSIALGLNLTHTEISLIGLFLAIFAAICWGSEIILSACVMKVTDSFSAYLSRQIGSVFGYIMILLYFKIGWSNHINLFLNTKFDLILLCIGLSTILSYFLYYQAIYILQPIRAMILNITYGSWAVLLNYLLYREPLTIQTVLLIFGMILGVFLILIEKRE